MQTTNQERMLKDIAAAKAVLAKRDGETKRPPEQGPGVEATIKATQSVFPNLSSSRCDY